MRQVDESVIAALASVADLPLSEARVKTITPHIEKLIADANVLSAKMAQPRWREIGPIIGVSAPSAGEAADDGD